LIIKDREDEEETYDIISETKRSSEFLLNLRSFIRLTGIIKMP